MTAGPFLILRLRARSATRWVHNKAVNCCLPFLFWAGLITDDYLFAKKKQFNPQVNCHSSLDCLSASLGMRFRTVSSPKNDFLAHLDIAKPQKKVKINRESWQEQGNISPVLINLGQSATNWWPLMWRRVLIFSLVQVVMRDSLQWNSSCAYLICTRLTLLGWAAFEYGDLYLYAGQAAPVPAVGRNVTILTNTCGMNVGPLVSYSYILGALSVVVPQHHLSCQNQLTLSLHNKIMWESYYTTKLLLLYDLKCTAKS